MHDYKEPNSDESVFLKEIFLKLEQEKSNIFNKQFYKTTTDKEVFKDSDSDENSDVQHDEEDYRNVISLHDENPQSPKMKSIMKQQLRKNVFHL